MNTLCKAVIQMACLTVLETVPVTMAQSKIEGAWKIAEVTMVFDRQ